MLKAIRHPVHTVATTALALVVVDMGQSGSSALPSVEGGEVLLRRRIWPFRACAHKVHFERQSTRICLASMSRIPNREVGRKTPAKGVHLILGQPNWVFLTVSSHQREPWLADSTIQKALHEIWQFNATTWLVSDYLLMPDHLHLFCVPRDLQVPLERWIAFWKDRLAKTCSTAGSFQSGGFHYRLRSGESYVEKWNYVRSNPVRAGLVALPEEWPYFGRVHEMLY